MVYHVILPGSTHLNMPTPQIVGGGAGLGLKAKDFWGDNHCSRHFLTIQTDKPDSPRRRGKRSQKETMQTQLGLSTDPSCLV